MNRRHRVLVVAPWIPYPLRSGGTYRVFNILRALSRHPAVDVTLLAPASPGDAIGIATLSDFGVSITTVPARSRRRSPVVYLNDLLSARPSTMVENQSRLKAALPGVIKQRSIDILQIEFLALAHLVAAVDTTVPRCLTAHFPAHETYARNASLPQDDIIARSLTRLDAKKLRRYEGNMYRLYDRIFVVSAEDGNMMPRLAGEARYVVAPNGVDLDYFAPSPHRNRSSEQRTVVSACSFQNSANLDGVKYFLREVWPLVLVGYPRARYQIIGRKIPQSVVSLAAASRGVDVVGEVDDIRPYFHAADASLVIMRAGGGSKIRLVTSLALGVPVVATSLGAEGIDITGLGDVRVSDSAEGLAMHVSYFLERDAGPSPLLRQRAVESYSWERTVDVMVTTYDELRT